MKGQVFTTDLLAATLIFLILVSFISILWIDITSAESRDSWRKITERETLKVTEALTRTKGLPENWEDNTSNILVLGLSQGNNNILDSDKVDAFFGLNYSTVRDIFDVGDFQVKFVDSNRTMGSKPPDYIGNIIFIRRFVLYNNSIEEINMMVWI